MRNPLGREESESASGTEELTDDQVHAFVAQARRAASTAISIKVYREARPELAGDDLVLHAIAETLRERSDRIRVALESEATADVAADALALRDYAERCLASILATYALRAQRKAFESTLEAIEREVEASHI